MESALLGDHSGDEILVADLAVGSDVDFTDPLVELGGLELLADVGEDVAKLRDGDKAGGVLVEDLEGITELAIEGFGFHVFGHYIKESGEVEGSHEVLFCHDGCSYMSKEKKDNLKVGG